MQTDTAHVWIVDDDRSIRWVLEKAFAQAGLTCRSFVQAQDMLEALAITQPCVILTDIRMPNLSGLSLLEKIKQEYSHIPIIVMTAHSDLDSAVASFEGGAFEYLPKPFDLDEIIHITERALNFARQSHITYLPDMPFSKDIIGEAPAMQEVFRAIGRLSQTNITVLINGQSGTGKELVAQALHKHSKRRQHPFIALNMAAIPRDLIESELFGHEKGAFTGAATQHLGRFEQANGGTLFLDEIGDMPLETQTRLLRVLADGEFYRVGGRTPVKVDVRIIAATHQNLEQLVTLHRFREDLFHRLNVIRIHIPALHQRAQDIPKLASHFLKRAAQEMAVDSKILHPETEAYLCQLEWPGNVRQLENVCRWLTVMVTGREVMINDLPVELKPTNLPLIDDLNQPSNWQTALRLWADQQLASGNQSLLNTALPEFEQTLIEVALQHTGGRRKDAAELLGWGRNTLTRKIKELAITSPSEPCEF
jgi:two-component system nitrogen regulation response regulator GlnG